jgi:hypothetical protein
MRFSLLGVFAVLSWAQQAQAWQPLKCETFFPSLEAEIHREGDIVAVPGEIVLSRPDRMTDTYSFSGIVGLKGELLCRGADQGQHAGARWIVDVLVDVDLSSPEQAEIALRLRRFVGIVAAASCIGSKDATDLCIRRIVNRFSVDGNKLRAAVERGEKDPNIRDEGSPVALSLWSGRAFATINLGSSGE